MNNYFKGSITLAVRTKNSNTYEVINAIEINYPWHPYGMRFVQEFHTLQDATTAISQEEWFNREMQLRVNVQPLYTDYINNLRKEWGLPVDEHQQFVDAVIAMMEGHDTVVANSQ